MQEAPTTMVAAVLILVFDELFDEPAGFVLGEGVCPHLACRPLLEFGIKLDEMVGYEYDREYAIREHFRGKRPCTVSPSPEISEPGIGGEQFGHRFRITVLHRLRVAQREFTDRVAVVHPA
jgi:hypothetical protein